ncbi:hypothetical protein TREMEDRAFT_63894 [Tremella mesenterica DSM 1558]|uniref:uncharacterized protein n=1 Tax=Tremella mesenterica (strain ATCC 24925 / CBS 8224 / DSM 1558 / NBRC 9311 / NRRL Y-6157 / RJB 2259-6 / UBC 559-6) TaxID=578456 RepID=UPI0003F48ED4|nr:uncharacterized protein TREMEDRAFT_63894 [Tremella mesenterica DSM 1558]EIW68010.1 hypothetical protein TREMEDRAFT_63894 [Tremella mesenterica DSM 1558]
MEPRDTASCYSDGVIRKDTKSEVGQLVTILFDLTLEPDDTAPIDPLVSSDLPVFMSLEDLKPIRDNLNNTRTRRRSSMEVETQEESGLEDLEIAIESPESNERSDELPKTRIVFGSIAHFQSESATVPVRNQMAHIEEQISLLLPPDHNGWPGAASLGLQLFDDYWESLPPAKRSILTLLLKGQDTKDKYTPDEVSDVQSDYEDVVLLVSRPSNNYFLIDRRSTNLG